MTLDDWNSILKLGSGLALALTFSVGIAALLVGHALGKRQALLIAGAKRDAALANEGLAKSNEEIARLNAESAKTAERTAALSLKVEQESRARVAAELELERLKKQSRPRTLPSGQFLERLSGQPTGTAFITYQRESWEAYFFALDLYWLLLEAGWAVPRLPRPATSRPELGALPIPEIMAAGGQAGVTLLVGPSEMAEALSANHSAIGALRNALGIGLEACGVDALYLGQDEALSASTVRIVIPSRT